MSRRSKGPRLYLRTRKGRKPHWIILDGEAWVRTGCGRDDREQAEKALADYIGRKHRVDFGSGDPAAVPVADVLNFYAQERGPALAHPELVGFHMGPLLEFFGAKTCSAVSGSTCRAYVKARVAGEYGRRKVKSGTARRELETLSAALNFAYKERRLSVPVPVTYPEKAPSRQRWLSRSEAAALLAGALGFSVAACDIQTRQPFLWRRFNKPLYHVARFILIGLYTGTRHEAILQMKWRTTSSGGWFDLERGVFYRRADDERETNKRRPPAPIPDRLMPHLKRWRKLTTRGPVEFGGELFKKEKRGWHSARIRAGLDGSVTPHVMRHTCATWLLQKRVAVWEVAGYLGTSEKVIRDTYGHHSPDHLQNARRAFSERNSKKVGYF